MDFYVAAVRVLGVYHGERPHNGAADSSVRRLSAPEAAETVQSFALGTLHIGKPIAGATGRATIERSLLATDASRLTHCVRRFVYHVNLLQALRIAFRDAYGVSEQNLPTRNLGQT